jgi:hypothetical protein
MSADGNVVLTAAQVRALESDVAALTQGASRPHMVGTSAFLDASTTTCVHGAWLKCPACPKDSVVRGETAYKTPVGHKVTGPELVWTMRDEFAKATMQTGCSVLDRMIDAERAEIAQRAYAMADAMIKAREKKP